MERFSGNVRLRPSREASILAAVVGVGMLITVALFFWNVLAGGLAFGALWVVTLLSIIGFHIYNAVSRRGVPVSQVDFHMADPHRSLDNSIAERLRELESLRSENLINESEYRQKRGEIMASKW